VRWAFTEAGLRALVLVVESRRYGGPDGTWAWDWAANGVSRLQASWGCDPESQPGKAFPERTTVAEPAVVEIELNVCEMEMAGTYAPAVAAVADKEDPKDARTG